MSRLRPLAGYSPARPVPQQRLSSEAGWYRGSPVRWLLLTKPYGVAWLAGMMDEEAMLTSSADFWIHQKQGQLVYQWTYVLDPRLRLGLLAPLTRCC